MKIRIVFYLFMMMFVLVNASVVTVDSEVGILDSVDPVVTISNPVEGEEFFTGETVNVEFGILEDYFEASPAEPVLLEFYYDEVHNSGEDVNLAAETDGLYEYNWVIPDLLSDNVSSQVTATDYFGNVGESSSGIFEINEPLNGPPDWTPISWNIYNMQVYAEVTLDGQPFVNDPGNILAAFGPGGENDCRAIGVWDQVGPYCIWYMTVRSNAEPEDMEPIDFKIYDASSDMIYQCEGEYQVYFADNSIVGSIYSPFQLIAPGNIPNLIADFEAALTTVIADQEIEFTDISTGNPVSWQWDFENDGVIDSYEQNPVWIYDEPGIYSVSLTVTNEVVRDTVTELKEDYITVLPATGFVTVEKQLLSSWNWFSLNVTANNMDINNVLESVEGSGHFLKDQSSFAFYYPETGWIGNLSEFDNYSMYKISMNAQSTLTVQGVPVNVEQTVYDLNSGWNWISYAPQTVDSLTSAFQDILDYVYTIQNQTHSADFYPEWNLWLGDLQYLEPLDAYKLRISEDCSFCYPYEEPTSRSKSVIVTDSGDNSREDSINIYDFQYNGTMILSSFEEMSIESKIIAKYGDEIRGESVYLDFTEQLGQKYYGLMVYAHVGNESGFQLYYQETEESDLVDLNYEFYFEDDMISGDFLDPIMITLPTLQFTADFSADIIEGYAPLEVQFTDLSVGNPVSWTWDFENDGVIDSYEQNPAWVYNEVGVYSVSLTVADTTGRAISTELKVDYISVVESHIFPRPWDQVFYTNSTTAYCEVTIDGFPASGGDEVGAFVETECRGIGQVTLNGSQALCAFNIQGEVIEIVNFAVYDISEDMVCTVSFETQTNPGGDIGYYPDYLPIAAVSSELVLSADFYADITTGNAPLEVQFTDLSLSNPVSWAWDFENDGITDSNEQNPIWIYEEAGIYSVSLAITDSMGRATSTELKEDFITVNEAIPILELPESISFLEDEAVSIDFLEYLSDDEVDSLSLDVTGNEMINAEINGTEVTFSAFENWFGSEEVLVTIDGEMVRFSTSDNVILNVEPVNDIPVINLPDIMYLDGLGELIIDLDNYAFDVDNDNLLYSVIAGNDLEAEVSGNMVCISSELSWLGSENVLFYADDQQGRSTACDTVLVIKDLSPYPVLESIIDVPEDQGGWVLVEFTRSCYDTDSLITRPGEYYHVEYLVEDNWIGVGSSSAYGADDYQVLVHTLQDSMPANPNAFEFRVIAAMEEGNFASNTLTGYSLDNICPQVPTELIFDSGNIVWNEPAVDDFAYFCIYRDSDLLDYSTEPTLNIIGDYGDYQVSAVDCHANESELSNAISGGYPYGDVDHNLEVEAVDASLVMQYFCLIITDWENWQIIVGDVDGNGSVEAYDAALILRFTVDFIDEFPVETITRKDLEK
ncbi:MAG: PKD domain-containing protein [Candidatus Stygibacter frigidus]|nr:PKD domain-containing protein [Candidatus Stygibacter frigidus]